MSFKFSSLPLMNILILIFFFTSSRKSLAAVDESFRICNATRNCGNLNIKFPFFIQEARCGYPGFNISCRNNRNPVFSLPDGDDYFIHEIFYHNQSFHISKVFPDDTCGNSFRNISIPEDRLYLSPFQTKMILFFDCVSALELPTALGFDKVICDAKYGTNVTLAMFSDAPRVEDALQYCNKTAVVPIAFPEGTNVQRMLNKGFMLNWKASNCSVCEESGGKCGFHETTNNFTCFCLDKPYASRCSPGNNSTTSLINTVAENNSTAPVIKVAAASSLVGIVVLMILVV